MRDSMKRGIVTAAMAVVNATPERIRKGVKRNLR
jgi:hypothetical protein